MPALCLNRSMTNEELSQQITALTTTITKKFNEIDTRLEGIDGRLDKLQAGQDDLLTKYDELNEKQGHIVNAQKTIVKMQEDLHHMMEEQAAKVEEDFTDMKATQAVIQHDIARINRKMIIDAGVRDTMHESVFTTQDSHYRDLDRRLRLVEAHFPELGQQGAYVPLVLTQRRSALVSISRTIARLSRCAVSGLTSSPWCPSPR